MIYNKPVSSLDIAATAVAHSGAKPVNELDGVDLIPFLTGENNGTPHEMLFWRKFDRGEYAARSGDMKLVNYKKSEDELFNLEEDISETTAVSNAERTEQLIDYKNKWECKMIDPIFLGLTQGKEYDELHPNRYKVEQY